MTHRQKRLKLTKVTKYDQIRQTKEKTTEDKPKWPRESYQSDQNCLKITKMKHQTWPTSTGRSLFPKIIPVFHYVDQFQSQTSVFCLPDKNVCTTRIPDFWFSEKYWVFLTIRKILPIHFSTIFPNIGFQELLLKLYNTNSQMDQIRK